MVGEKATGIQALLQSVVRSKSFSYGILCIVVQTTLWVYISFYSFLEENSFIAGWKSPNDWYLQHFRPFSAWVWKATRTMTSSTWYLSIPIFLLILVGILNIKLSYLYSCRINTFTVIVWLVAFLIGMGCLINLTHLPLI